MMGRARLAWIVPFLMLIVACDRKDTYEPPPEETETETATEAKTATAELPAVETQRRYPVSNYEDVERLFEELNYTPAAWQAGVREVPRVFITDIPERWRNETTKQITVQRKKRLFFRALAPLALRAAELIDQDREQLERLIRNGRDGRTHTESESAWLRELAMRYDVAASPAESLSEEQFDELLRRVDYVPVSLTLSQGAEESGWGTSRFAAEGNALFGQWTWGENAIKPENQREKLGNYGIAAFETPLQSVLAYMHNLNTHRAYADLRRSRADLRSRGEPISGRVLAESLTRYSERGPAYVKSLHAIMSVNQLDAADSAYLADGPTILLVPAGADGS